MSYDRRCILSGRVIDDAPEAMTLCEREVDTNFEWLFQGPTHAVLTGIGSSIISVCEDCANVAIKALEDLK